MLGTWAAHRLQLPAPQHTHSPVYIKHSAWHLLSTTSAVKHLHAISRQTVLAELLLICSYLRIEFPEFLLHTGSQGWTTLCLASLWQWSPRLL